MFLVLLFPEIFKPWGETEIVGRIGVYNLHFLLKLSHTWLLVLKYSKFKLIISSIIKNYFFILTFISPCILECIIFMIVTITHTHTLIAQF